MLYSMRLKRLRSIIKNALRKITRLNIVVKSSEDKLRSFFESSDSIHLLIGLELEVIDFNRAAVNFVKRHYDIDLTPGLNITSCIPKKNLAYFLASYHKVLDGVPVRVECKLKYVSESIIWFINYEPAKDRQGKILGMSLNAIDITEKIAIDHKISTQYHSLQEIAYIQSHNLRQPVSSIMGLVSLFKADDYTSDREGLLMLERAVQQLNEEMTAIVKCTN